MANYKPHGYWEIFYPDGTLKTTYNFNNGKKVGPAKLYDETGKQTILETYQNDTLSGPYVEFGQNGNKLYEAYYSYGKQTDSSFKYNQKGIIQEICIWNSGKKNGPFVTFHRDTNLVFSKGNYKNNKLYRLWKL